MVCMARADMLLRGPAGPLGAVLEEARVGNDFDGKTRRQFCFLDAVDPSSVHLTLHVSLTYNSSETAGHYNTKSHREQKYHSRSTKTFHID